MMKKSHNITGKSNLIKYLNPATKLQNKVNSKNKAAHSRSMDELDRNLVSQQANKQNISKAIHHTSLLHDQNTLNEHAQGGKSKSLRKFMDMFQGVETLTQDKKQSSDKRCKQAAKETKRKCYNGFSYDLKICSKAKKQQSTMVTNNPKDNRSRSPLSQIRSVFMAQKNPGKQQTGGLVVKKQNSYFGRGKSPNQEIISKSNKGDRDSDKIRELNQLITSLNIKNQALQGQKNTYIRQVELLKKKDEQNKAKMSEYESQIQNLRKQAKKSSPSGKEHMIIIKSLKKVINQQLNKIIELEKSIMEARINNQLVNEDYLSVSEEEEENRNGAHLEQKDSSDLKVGMLDIQDTYGPIEDAENLYNRTQKVKDKNKVSAYGDNGSMQSARDHQYAGTDYPIRTNRSLKIQIDDQNCTQPVRSKYVGQSQINLVVQNQGDQFPENGYSEARSHYQSSSSKNSRFQLDNILKVQSKTTSSQQLGWGKTYHLINDEQLGCSGVIQEASDSNEEQDHFTENINSFKTKLSPKQLYSQARSNDLVDCHSQRRSKFETEQNQESQNDPEYIDGEMSFQEGEGDSILQEVDQYLSQFRGK